MDVLFFRKVKNPLVPNAFESQHFHLPYAELFLPPKFGIHIYIDLLHVTLTSMFETVNFTLTYLILFQSYKQSNLKDLIMINKLLFNFHWKQIPVNEIIPRLQILEVVWYRKYIQHYTPGNVVRGNQKLCKWNPYGSSQPWLTDLQTVNKQVNALWILRFVSFSR